MLRFVLKELKDTTIKVKTIDLVIPILEDNLKNDCFGREMIIIGVEKLPCCDICFRQDCQSDHERELIQEILDIAENNPGGILEEFDEFDPCPEDVMVHDFSKIRARCLKLLKGGNRNARKTA